MPATMLSSPVTQAPPIEEVEAEHTSRQKANLARLAAKAAAERSHDAQVRSDLCDLRKHIFNAVVLQLAKVSKSKNVQIRGTEVNHRNGCAILYVKPICDGLLLQAITADEGEPSLEITLSVNGIVIDKWVIRDTSPLETNLPHIVYSIKYTNLKPSAGSSSSFLGGLNGAQAVLKALEAQIAEIIVKRRQDL